MRRPFLIVLLAFGVVAGFGSGFASIRHRRLHERGCHGWDDRFSQWDRARPAEMTSPAAASPVVVNAPATPATAPVIVNAPAAPAAAPAPTVIVIGNPWPQGAQTVTVPPPPPAAAH